jgi:hypothetical protein
LVGIIAWITLPYIIKSVKNNIIEPLKRLVGLGTDTSKGADMDSWQKILDDYSKNKCQVERFTCKVQSFPCQCFTLGAKNAKQKPDICDAAKPYCYDGQIGCSNRAPDVPLYFDYCKSTQNFNTADIPECMIDGKCKPTYLPCRCSNAGKQSMLCIGTGNAYCSKNNLGCVSQSC